MTPEHEKLRDLCRQAVCEKDVNKLLKVFLELDRMTEREQRRSVLTKPLERSGESAVKKHSETQ